MTELEALRKVAERANVAAEFMYGLTLGTGGSKVLALLDEALSDLKDLKNDNCPKCDQLKELA